MKRSSEELTKVQSKEVDHCLKQIQLAMLDIGNRLLDMGAQLTRVKEILPHGQFVPWLKEQCHFDKRTAQQYMAAHKAFANFNRIALVDHRAIHLIATCPEAVAEAKALANKGKRVDEQMARAMLGQYKPAKSANVCAFEAGSNGEAVDVASKPVEREPGDDTEAIKADAAKHRGNGREAVAPRKRQQMVKEFGHVCAFVQDTLGRHDLRPGLLKLMAIIEGKS